MFGSGNSFAPAMSFATGASGSGRVWAKAPPARPINAAMTAAPFLNNLFIFRLLSEGGQQRPDIYITIHTPGHTHAVFHEDLHHGGRRCAHVPKPVRSSLLHEESLSFGRQHRLR